jgi:hypothetical protein
MTDIVVYLATNGVTIQDTNDTIWWACSTAQEMINWIEVPGRFVNLFTGTLYEPIRQDFQVPCPDSSFTHTRKWYKEEAESRMYPLMEVPSLFVSSAVQMEHQVYEQFGRLPSPMTSSLTQVGKRSKLAPNLQRKETSSGGQ